MNKLRALLVVAALLTAACGATTVSGSSVKSVSNAGNVHVDAGANAGTDVAAGTEDDLSRPNPPVHKSGPVPPQQSIQPATTESQPSSTGGDRCSAGFAANTVGSRGGSSGKHLPQPECPVE
jgi:hypothetical protein